MIMVTPYVITDHEEGWDLTRRIRDRLELHSNLAEEQESLQRPEAGK